MAILGRRCNVVPWIRNDGVPRKFVPCYAQKLFEIVVRPSFERLQGACVRGARCMTSVCKRRANVKGEMFPDHARARGDAGALDPVARRTKKKCLWGEVSGE